MLLFVRELEIIHSWSCLAVVQLFLHVRCGIIIVIDLSFGNNVRVRYEKDCQRGARYDGPTSTTANASTMIYNHADNSNVECAEN